MSAHESACQGAFLQLSPGPDGNLQVDELRAHAVVAVVRFSKSKAAACPGYADQFHCRAASGLAADVPSGETVKTAAGCQCEIASGSEGSHLLEAGNYSRSTSGCSPNSGFPLLPSCGP